MSEIVMWGIEVNGKVHSAEFHKLHAELHVATGNDRNDGFQYKLVPLCRAPLQQEADKDGELTKIGMLIRPRSGLINFVQEIDVLPLGLHETMDVYAALPSDDKP